MCTYCAAVLMIARRRQLVGLVGTYPDVVRTCVVVAEPPLLAPPALALVVIEASKAVLPSALHSGNDALTSFLVYLTLLSGDEAALVFVLAEDSLGLLVVKALAVLFEPGFEPTVLVAGTLRVPHGPDQPDHELAAILQPVSLYQAALVPQKPPHGT